MLCVDDGNGAAFTLTLAEGAVLQLRLPADYPLVRTPWPPHAPWR